MSNAVLIQTIYIYIYIYIYNETFELFAHLKCYAAWTGR